MTLHPIRTTDQHLVDTHTTYVRVPGRHWPSDASAIVTINRDPRVVGECLRKLWYRYRGVPPTDLPDATLVRKQTVGRLIEAQERVWLAQSHQLLDEHVPVERQHPADPSLTVAGELDAVLRNTPPVIVEIKTSHGYSFQRDVLNGDAARPYPAHLLQGMLYLDLYPSASEVLFLYIDRGTLLRREHRLSLTQTGHAVVNGTVDAAFHLGLVYRRMIELHQAVQSGHLPARDYFPLYDERTLTRRHAQGQLSTKQVQAFRSGERFGDWQCASCPFRSRCLDD